MAFYIYMYIFFFHVGNIFPLLGIERERERVVLVKLDENKNHPFFPTQVGRSFLSESVISILHSITLELIALFSLPPPPRSFVFFVLDEATHHLKVDVHSTPIFYSVRLTSEKFQVGIREKRKIDIYKLYVSQLLSSLKLE